MDLVSREIRLPSPFRDISLDRIFVETRGIEYERMERDPSVRTNFLTIVPIIWIIDQLLLYIYIYLTTSVRRHEMSLLSTVSIELL